MRQFGVDGLILFIEISMEINHTVCNNGIRDSPNFQFSKLLTSHLIVDMSKSFV